MLVDQWMCFGYEDLKLLIIIIDLLQYIFCWIVVNLSENKSFMEDVFFFRLSFVVFCITWLIPTSGWVVMVQDQQGAYMDHCPNRSRKSG
jgi:hypothetical protein